MRLLLMRMLTLTRLLATTMLMMMMIMVMMLMLMSKLMLLLMMRATTTATATTTTTTTTTATTTATITRARARRKAGPRQLGRGALAGLCGSWLGPGRVATQPRCSSGYGHGPTSTCRGRRLARAVALQAGPVLLPAGCLLWPRRPCGRGGMGRAVCGGLGHRGCLCRGCGAAGSAAGRRRRRTLRRMRGRPWRTAR